MKVIEKASSTARKIKSRVKRVPLRYFLSGADLGFPVMVKPAASAEMDLGQSDHVGESG